MRNFLKSPLTRTASFAFVFLAIPLVVALAQTHLRGGSASGVALQTTSPGIMQTGNANISGSLCVGCSSSTTGGILSYPGGGPGFVNLTYPGTSLSSNNAAFELLFSGTPAAFNRISNFSYGNHNSVGYIGFGANTTISRLGLAPVGAFTSGAEIVTGVGPLALNGSGNAGNTDNVIIDTQGGNQTGGNLLNVRLNGVSKASILTTGAPSFANPVPLTSGGTGQSTALSCSAGQFWTSNGASVSCGPVANGAIVASANISSTGVINKQNPASVISSVTKGGTGVYTVNLTGMTTTGIVTCTPYQGASPGYMCTVTPGSGTIAITIVNGANGVADQQFMLTVASL